MKRVRVEDLADRRIHQREQRIAGHVIVPAEDDLLDHRILDHTEGDRDAAGTLADERRHLIGEVAEIEDALEIGAHGGFVERFAHLGLHDRENLVGGYVCIP
jgi:hypothetical protein